MPRWYSNLILCSIAVAFAILSERSASAGMIILGGDDLDRVVVSAMEIPGSELPGESPAPSERRLAHGSPDGMSGESRSSSQGPSTGGVATIICMVGSVCPELDEGLPGEARFALPTRLPLELLRPS